MSEVKKPTAPPAPLPSSQTNEVFAEIKKAPPRLQTILYAALVDDCLGRAIKFVLLGGDAFLDQILDHQRQGFAAPYAARVDLAFAIGLIDSDTRADFKKIGKIRNLFAHALLDSDGQKPTFKTKDVVKWCGELNNAAVGCDDPQERFVSCVKATVPALLEKAWDRRKMLKESQTTAD